MNSLETFLTSLSSGQKHHGGHKEAISIKLRAGNLSVIYQNGSLRHISDKNSEIIRMIYSAVRDKDWLTIEPVISNEQIETRSDSFTIVYDCNYSQGDISFYARYTIEGGTDNSVVFRMEGEALKTFEKSRTGFCILHPVGECAGQKCEIIHSNGLSEILEFPYLISPVQIFMDISSMKWKAGDAGCRIDFEGEIFETEDQRNWTDASYKTYCTPLELPCPARLEKGTRVYQQVKLKVDEAVPSGENEEDIIEIAPDTSIQADIPKIGLGRSTRNIPLSDDEISVLNQIKFDHYRTDLYLFRDDWKDIANAAAAEAIKMNCRLEIALFLDSAASEQAAKFGEWASGMKADIALISLFHESELATPPKLQKTIPSILRTWLPGVKIGFGTNANYAELGRSWPGSGGNNIVCFSVHPQEHASDNATIVENLHGQAYTVTSAVALAHGKDVWVSPVNIQRRFNANVEAYEHTEGTGVFPSQADSRIMSLIGAGWTMASIRYITESGAGGITYFETAGERGIIQGDHDSRWPADFPSAKGMIFPVYHVFCFLLKDRSFRILKSSSSNPLAADGIFLSDGDSFRTILANFTSEPRHLKITGIEGDVRMKTMNDTTFVHLATDPGWLRHGWANLTAFSGSLDIDPYSLVLLEYPVNI